MTDLHGEITTYLDAIGTEDGSEAMITAMELVGTTFTIAEFTSLGMYEKYLEFTKGGVEFLVIDGVVDTIFFQLVDATGGAAYRDPDALIPGLRHGMSRAAVIELLGEPVYNERKYLLYGVGEKFLNVQLEGDQVDSFSVQSRDLNAELESAPDTSAAPVEEETPGTPITGEISLFRDAVGSAYGAAVMVDLVDALGSFDSHDTADDHGRGTFLVFDSAGVDLQYRNEVLIGVLIHVADDGRRPYPRLGTLVDGLALPATRADVTAALGAPRTALDDCDIYIEHGRHVMFQYTGEATTTISIVGVPATP